MAKKPCVMDERLRPLKPAQVEVKIADFDYTVKAVRDLDDKMSKNFKEDCMTAEFAVGRMKTLLED